MADALRTFSDLPALESVATFEWRDLHLHVVTRRPLTGEQVRALDRVLPTIPSVGRFADAVSIILGRHVRIRTERPSPDVRLEVGP